MVACITKLELEWCIIIREYLDRGAVVCDDSG